MARRRIGILGGSFNPAHATHRRLSLLALARLGLDEVWWMVAPQNPLKPVKGMAPLAARLDRAREVANHPRVKVTDIEGRLGTIYTVDTLRALRRRFPSARFVFLSGADILGQLPRWKAWRALTRLVPLAVFHRPSVGFTALAGQAAHALRRFRRRGRLICARPPAWQYVWASRSTLSATDIRDAGAWPPSRHGKSRRTP